MNTQILARVMLDCTLERIAAVYEMIKRLISPMPNWARFGLVLALLLPANLAVQAADYYVAQVATGTGGSATTATNVAWFNTASNWRGGAGTIQPGDVIHLVGTISSPISIGASGNPGAPITLYFEPNAKLSAPTLPVNSVWLNLGNAGNIVIDGGQNGRIELTDNGTVVANGGTHTYGNSGVRGIYGSGVNGITMQNLTIANMYDRQSVSEPIQGANGDGAGVNIAGSNITLTNCTIAGCQEAFTLVYTTTVTSNLLVTHCTFTNYNHGITIGSGGQVNPVFLNLAITHNVIRSGDSFETCDTCGDLGLHRNAIFIFNESELAPTSGGLTSGMISNIVIAYNFIKHGEHPQSHTAGSGGMFFDTYNNASTVHVRVYNNISTLAAPLAWSGGGGCAAAAGTDALFANNTIVGWPTNAAYGGGYSFTISGTNAYAFNNISISSMANFVTAEVDSTGLPLVNATYATLLSGVISDYNIFNGISGNSAWVEVFFYKNNGGVFQEALYDTLPQFQGMFGGLVSQRIEPHSTLSTVQLNSSFMPLTNDVVAIGHGTNLTAWGITDDFAGNSRPATGNWTIGAYQVAGANITVGTTNSTGGSTNPAPITFVSGVPDVTNGLILRYKLNEGSGTTVNDSSGNAYSGVLQGHAAWTNGINSSSGAISFPSNDGNLNSPDGVYSSALNYSGDWTIAFWAYNNSFPGVYNYAVSTAPSTGVYINYNNVGYTWGVYDGVSFLNGASRLNLNQWYFVVVSKSGGTNYQLYLNGVPDHAGTLANINISTLTIGNRGGSFLGMNGRVEDFRIYNRTLSASEVANLNSNGPNYVPPSLAVTPSSLNFGMVTVGAVTNETFTLQNTGSSTVTGNISVAAPFAISSGGTYSLAGGQSETVSVSYTPTAAGTNSQLLTFTGGGATMALAGTAVSLSVLLPPTNLQVH